MEIELWSGVSKAIIDPLGGWVTNLSDDRGDILFPKRSLKTEDGAVKIRGGCHICLPNFGPGGASGQPQHGFGRELVWSVREQASDSVVLDLAEGRGGYELLHSTIEYRLNEASLELKLTVTNDDSHELRVAPGFHPYFATLGTVPIMINDIDQPLEDIQEAQFVTADTMQLRTSSRLIMLRAEQLPMWAKWTDQLGPYVCIEPTVNGFTFLRDVPTAEELLTPGQSKTYSHEIAWQ